MTPETRFYVRGTLADPLYLARSKWPPPARADDPPHTVFDPRIDDWVANPGIGRMILNGDTALDEIHASDVDAVKARLRAGYAAAGLLPRLGRDVATAWGVDRDRAAAA